MPATATTNGTPDTRSTDPATYGPAPATAVAISPSVDMTLVTTFRDIIRKAGTLTNSRTYPNATDDAYKSDLRFMRKHLKPVLTDSERIKVVNFGEPGAISFYLTLAKRNPRKAKETPAAETPATK